MPLQDYQAKPVKIQAIQLTKDNRDEVVSIIGKEAVEDKPWDPVNVFIRQGGGVTMLAVGHYAIKSPRGWDILDNIEFEGKYIRSAPNPAMPQGVKK